MRLSTHLFSVLPALLIGTSASALTVYSDADSFGGLNPTGSTPVGQTLSAGQSIAGTFNFVSDDGTSGFTIGSPYPSFERDTYLSALGFSVGSDTVVPESGYMKFFVREGVSDFEIFTISLADITFQSSVFSTAFTISSGATATVEGSINAFGEVAYSITANYGSFVVDGAYMEVAAQPVPDGGFTVVLLGSALLGIMAFRSKFCPGLAL